MRKITSVAALAAAASLCTAAAVAPAIASATVASHSKHVKLAGIKDPLSTSGDEFGHGVAISASGSEILVGAYKARAGNGVAYLYAQAKGKWKSTPTASFKDPAKGGDHFGFSVALSPNGSTAYVGADQVTVGTRGGAGAVYVYRKSSKGTWPSKPSQVIDDPGKGTNDYFGVGLAISSDGGTLVVGAPGATIGTTSEAGKVYVYTASHGKLPASPSASISYPAPASPGLFGYSVSVSDNSKGKGVLIAGAYFATVKGANDAGAAYLFDAKGPHSWKLAKGGTLTDPADTGTDFFGAVVTIDGAGTLAMVGAQDEMAHAVADAGAVFAFALRSGAWKGPVQTLTGPIDGAANFASPALSANGAIAITGAPNESDGANNYAGEAFAYVRSGSSYALGASIPDPTGGSPTGPDYFGYASAVSANGGRSVIGAPATPGSGGQPGPGAVYVFDTAP